MRIEDKLRQTLKRATLDEPLPRDVWTSFEQRARRHTRVRYGATALSFAVVIALAAVAVPRLTTDSDTGLSDATAGWTVFENDALNYRLRHPATWRSGRSDDGLSAFVIPPGTAPAGTDSFEMRISLDRHTQDFTNAKTQNGIRYLVFGADGSQRTIEYAFEWGDAQMLRVTLQSQTEEELARYREEAELIVGTLERCECGTAAPEWKTFRNDRLGYEIAYPNDWKYGMFEAVDEFEPQELPGLPVGLPTFAVEVQLAYRAFDATQEGVTSDDLFSGRKYMRSEQTRGDEHKTQYLVEWGEGLTLEVRIYASTPELRAEHRETGDEVVRSIRKV